MLASPRAQLPVLGMAPVPQRLQQILVAPNASAILGRTGASAFDTARNQMKISAGPHLFDGNKMHPAIAEIVLVAKADSFLASDVAQPDPLVTLHVVVIVRVWFPIARLANEKLMEMRVFPPHNDLQEVVQGGKPDLVRDHESSPDRGFNARQANIQLVDTLC